jgi:hypothetical protein
MRLVERELQVAVVRDAAGIRDGARELGEGWGYLLRGFDVELIGVELHPVRVATRLAGLQAEHQFVRVRIFFLEVVAVIGACHRDIELPMDLDQAGIGDALVVEAVGLHFEVEVLLPKDLLKFACHGHRAVHIFLADEVRNLAAETA